ncbi:clostripain [Tepidibacter mesophilus]|uniref:clostripain n=1 Tax=Tepidibacter mesophilus TaxID=655607 RepID=UPI000C08C159|nr:clostripain [Tepidibacter mesophilus]
MMKKRTVVLSLVLMTSLFFANPNVIKAEEGLKSNTLESTADPVMESVYEKPNETQVETLDRKPITIMYYCDADNDLESDLLNDVEEIKKGITNEINLVTLIDRTEGYTSNKSVLGEDFSDTRLYEINPKKAIRISGGEQFPEITTTSTNFEANMGDANTLKNFIDLCKEKYPADKYVLILANHGGGPKTNDEAESRRAICWDETNGMDTLYTGEISDVLTKEQSVDVFGLDACFMGNAEFAYQFHKGNGGFEADIMVACAPTEWGDGWQYNKILDRLQSKDGDNGEEDLTLKGKEKYYSPKSVTAAEIGGIIIEEQRDSCEGSITDQTLACYDMSKIKDVKVSVDALALTIQDKKLEVENIRGEINNPKIMYYFNSDNKREQLNYPFFDLYDLAKKIEENKNLEKNIKDKAQSVMDAVDDMVLYSYGGKNYKEFKDGKNGLSIFFPSGESKIYMNRKLCKQFEFQYWYSPNDLTEYLALGDSCYGKLKWCQDGLNQEINKVGNWFELLDSWYDDSNDLQGGYNQYQW